MPRGIRNTSKSSPQFAYKIAVLIDVLRLWEIESKSLKLKQIDFASLLRDIEHIGKLHKFRRKHKKSQLIAKTMIDNNNRFLQA